jgi:Glycosyl transferase family 2
VNVVTSLLADIHKVDQRNVPVDTFEIRVFSCVRNESIRIPHFLRHYRRLGAGRFFIIDNGSTDDTMEMLLLERDVHVFAATGSFRAARSGNRWIRELISAYGRNTWVVVADCDELLMYPYAWGVTLGELAAYLDHTGSQALYSLLIDMYGSGDVSDNSLCLADELWKACPFYETDSIEFVGYRKPPLAPTPMHIGGVRKRLFGLDCCLDKINFFRANEQVVIHEGMHGISGATISDIQGVTLHFKFFGDFRARVREEAARGEHWQGAREYRRYEHFVNSLYPFQILDSSSRRLNCLEDLSATGLVKSLPAFLAFVSRLRQERG